MAKNDWHNVAKIRFLAAVFAIPFVDVLVNGIRIVSKIPYRKTSNYISLEPGFHTVEIVSSEDSHIKLVCSRLKIDSGKVYTLAIAGRRENANLLMVQNLPMVPLDEAKMRFLHLAPELPAVDFAVKGRDVVFPDIAFQQITDYLGLTPMTVDLELRTSGSKQVVLPMPKLQFKANETYTIVLISSETELSISVIIE